MEEVAVNAVSPDVVKKRRIATSNKEKLVSRLHTRLKWEMLAVGLVLKGPF